MIIKVVQAKVQESGYILVTRGLSQICLQVREEIRKVE
jgi:hypothetical protein